MREPRIVAIVLATMTFAAACTPSTENNSATVRYFLDAPFCGGLFPVELQIDHAVVAIDTFRIHLPSPRETSNAFAVSPGTHVLSARYMSYVFPEKSVLLTPGQAVLDSLPFYCS